MTHEGSHLHSSDRPLDRQAFLQALEASKAREPWLAEARGRNTVLDPDEREQWLRDVKQKGATVSVQRSSAIRSKSRWMLFPTIGVMTAAALFWLVAPEQRTSSQEYATGTGEQRIITLADGSSVTLAPKSRLTLDNSYGKQERTVSLEGEALFQVVPHSSAPFIVTTGAVVTKVLGTEFVARRYQGEATARVAVLSGKVSVQGNQKSVTLTAGMIGTVNDSTATSWSSTAEAERLRAWTRGQLVFVSAPVHEVLASLGRWYGYEFKLADSTAGSQRVTATFDVSSSSETLTELKRLLGVTMNVSGRIVILRPDSTPRELRDRAVPTKREQFEQSSIIQSGVGR